MRNYHFKKAAAIFLALMFTFMIFIGTKGPVLASAGDTGTEGNYTWTELTDGTAEVSAYTGGGGIVTIPSTIAGRNVSAIGNETFKNNTTITKINFHNGITAIGNEACYGCTSLADAALPGGLKKAWRRGVYQYKNCADNSSGKPDNIWQCCVCKLHFIDRLDFCLRTAAAESRYVFRLHRIEEPHFYRQLDINTSRYLLGVKKAGKGHSSRRADNARR